MSILICPVCGGKLELYDRTFVCGNKHCFDMAKSGYVNLLPTNQGGSVHGDNKMMLRARRDFLEKGYYSPLCEKIAEVALKYAHEGCVFLDAGCGEGYYTTAVKAKIDRSKIAAKMYGIDVSKDAVDMASKRHSGVRFAAASVFHIPVMDESCDVLLTMFAPYCGGEYSRVLKKDGVMIMAIPSKNHLWELKCQIYDKPYKNEVRPYELEGFTFIKSEKINFMMQLVNKNDIYSLFTMTPYYYKSGKIEQQRLAALENLETQADFEVLIYQKSEKD